MCTVALAYGLYPGLPIVLAANRDEQRARPSTSWRAGSLAPQIGGAAEQDLGHAVFAPRDRVAGGTWIGINRQRMIAAITNRFGNPRDPARRSRGLLVLEALGAPDVASAAQAIGAIPPASVSPFHLLIADAHEAVLLVHDGEGIHTRAVEPGWTVITERSFGAASADREARVHAALTRHDEPPSPQQLRDALAVHATGDQLDARVAATCVHIDELGYGTRSSSLMYLDARGEGPAPAVGPGDDHRHAHRGDAGPRLFHADGPPCVTAYQDLSGALAAFVGDGR